MIDGQGPWQERRTSDRSTRIRFVVWLLVLVLLGAGVWTLDGLFPGRMSSDLDWAYGVRAIVLLALVSGGVVFASRVPLKETLRNVLAWTAIVSALGLGFVFQDELTSVAQRVRSELIPGEPISAAADMLVLSQSEDGHFYAMAEANGVRVRFLIDTGASDIVLSPSDATRIGIDVKALDFTRTYQTANGVGSGAPYRLAQLSLGPIALSDVPASINRADMDSSLLGMAFLRQMTSFEIQGRRLILRWR